MKNKSTFLPIALASLERGWHVFPCRGKFPAIPREQGGRGYLDASNDETKIREWAGKFPTANVGIACGASGLAVIDLDHGCSTLEEAENWIERSGLPKTYTVRTGRRTKADDPSTTECGVQLYFAGVSAGSREFDIAGCTGDIRAAGNYVMAAGSIHPKSGKAYEVIVDAPIAPLPELLKVRVPPKRAHSQTKVSPDTIERWREFLRQYITDHDLILRDYEKLESSGVWLGIACPFDHASGSPGTESSTVLGFFGSEVVFRCAHATCETAGRDSAYFRDQMFLKEGEKWAKTDATENFLKNVIDEPPDSLCARCQRSLDSTIVLSDEEYLIRSAKQDGEGWFPFGAINIIAGSSGSGKSYWLDEMLEAVRNGRDFCGHKTTKSEYLVLLRDRSLKDAGTTWKKQLGILGRFREIADNHPVKWEVFTRCFQELSTAEKNAPIAEVIDNYARLHPEIRVIAVEGLDLWVPSKMMDPDKTEATLRALQAVAQKHSIALIGTLGSPKIKGIDSYVGRDNLYGSTITGRMSDTVVVVNKHKRDDESSARAFDILLRHTKAEKFYFNWDEEGRFTQVDEPTANPAETESHRRLREIAQKCFMPGEAVVFAKLRESWGCHENTFNKWRKSVEGRYLIRKGGNYYLNAAYLPGCEPPQR